MTATDQALTYLLSPARSGIDPDLFVPLLRLLAEGEPVTVAELATASGRSEDTVRQGLAAVPDTEYDDEGRIIGLALTMRPTPHRFTLAGEQLYTWCALDTLFFPALIGKAATIESTSPGSGTLIRVMTGADGTVTSVQPATAGPSSATRARGRCGHRSATRSTTSPPARTPSRGWIPIPTAKSWTSRRHTGPVPPWPPPSSPRPPRGPPRRRTPAAEL